MTMWWWLTGGVVVVAALASLFVLRWLLTAEPDDLEGDLVGDEGWRRPQNDENGPALPEESGAEPFRRAVS